ncbi:MAG: c-type cytochrome [Pseudomonadota bacterium]
MKKWLGLLPLAGALVFAGNVNAAGDSAAGQQKSAVCAGCHGADGNSANAAWPKLAGQHEIYIVKQLADFKSGERNNATMSPMAAPLSEQDMQDLAAYYAVQPLSGGEADPTQVDLGEKIFRGGNPASGVAACASCHAPNGIGNPPANFPRVSGQHADYLETTLKEFRNGARTNDAAKMMQNIAVRMTDAEIKAVAQYMQGLR